MTIARKMTGLVASAALLSTTMASAAAAAAPIRPAAPIVSTISLPVTGTPLGGSARSGAAVGQQSKLNGFSLIFFTVLLGGVAFFIGYRIARDKFRNRSTSPGN